MRSYFIFGSLFLAACGGRVSHPVALEQSFDDKLTCAHYEGEYENNLKRLEELTGESKDKLRDNFGLLISSPLFLDFSNTQKKEAEAILARNQRLSELMAQKECAPQNEDPEETPAPAEAQPSADSEDDDAA